MLVAAGSAGASIAAATAASHAVRTSATSQLRLKAGTGGAAGGHYRQVFVFTNRGSRACVLRGHPGVQFVDASGKAMRTRPTYSGSYTFAEGPKQAIRIRPGHTASFDLAPPATGARSCPRRAASIRVIPPNDRAHRTVRDSFPYCRHGTVAVSNVAKGSNGQPPPGA